MASDLLSYYLQLNKFVEIGSVEKVPKLCNKILQEFPNEKEAFQCGIVAHIKMGKFSQALNMFNQYKISKDFYFEQAYCHYRLDEIDRAYTVLSSGMKEFNVRDGELMAQILYKLERYRESVDMYDKLLKNTDDDYQSEREANMLASIVGLLNSGELVEIPKFRSEVTYELAFNCACALLVKHELDEACELLQSSEKLCIQAYNESKEDGGANDFPQWINPVISQLATCYIELGRLNEATDILSRVRQSVSLQDSVLSVIVANNLALLKHSRLSNYQKVKQLLAKNMDAKLWPQFTSEQKKKLAENVCILQCHPLAKEINEKAMKDVITKYPELKYLDVLARALLKIRKRNVDEGVATVKEYLQKDNEHALFITLTVVHVLLEKGERQKALEFLEALNDENKLKPGVTALRINIYESLGKHDKIASTLNETMGWYSRRKDLLKSSMIEMFAKAAKFLIKHGQAQLAAKYLEDVLPADKSNTTIIALLVIAYTEIDTEKASKYYALLPEEDDDIDNDNPDFVYRFKKSTFKKRDNLDPNTPELRKSEISKNKRKRKVKLPKNYVEGQVPDPERWLPKYERSDFRKKRRNRLQTKAVMKGSQGTVHQNVKNFDYSAKKDQPGEATPRAAPGGFGGKQRPASGKPGGSGKPHKGKKKGGRR